MFVLNIGYRSKFSVISLYSFNLLLLAEVYSYAVLLLYCIHAELLFISSTTYCPAARGGAVGWGTALQVGRSRVPFLVVSLEFVIDIILPAALWPWDTDSKRNVYQEYFLGR